MIQKQAVDFVRHILLQICEKQSEVHVDYVDDERGTLITVKVAESDMGRLIGKDGQTISAVRLLVRSMGARENARINLKVSEPEA